MTTGTKIIESALKKIGAHSIAAPADPESIELGMETLNSMLQLWLSEEIDLGIVPLRVPGDELGEPLDAKQVIINNLAIMSAPNYASGKNIITPELRAAANVGYEKIKNLYQVLSIPGKVMSSTLPRGAGNSKGSSHTTFAGVGATVDSSDA